MPLRIMHIRHRRPFTDVEFAQFAAHCDIFRAFVEAVFRNWAAIRTYHNYPAPRYEFGEPTLSPDRLIASLPIRGEQTLGSRSEIENMSSYMLWQFFAPEFRSDLEEGITEDFGTGMRTTWRAVPKFFVYPNRGA
jgi:hypothetical protein